MVRALSRGMMIDKDTHPSILRAFALSLAEQAPWLERANALIAECRSAGLPVPLYDAEDEDETRDVLLRIAR